MNIILIGYRGSGKTTVVQCLAAKLAWPWIDADDQIELLAARTIADIFATQGEAAFRDLESQTLIELVKRDQAVIALGGGVILRPENRELLKQKNNFVIWLTAPVEELHARIQADKTTTQRRPALSKLGDVEEIRELLNQREPWYRECSQLMIDCSGKSPGTIADEIVNYLQQNLIA